MRGPGELSRIPRAEQPANKNNLAEMVRIVIGDEKSFAKNCLSGAMRDSRK